ncbi:hypothetical protein, partial [Streptomyces umbrinus]|uniref:hypothetical protein n=1 Tax=Streptomyces umbrinus TaxID=67370 RepID=UPI0033EBDCCA
MPTTASKPCSDVGFDRSLPARGVGADQGSCRTDVGGQGFGVAGVKGGYGGFFPLHRGASSRPQFMK